MEDFLKFFSLTAENSYYSYRMSDHFGTSENVEEIENNREFLIEKIRQFGKIGTFGSTEQDIFLITG